MHEGVDLAEVTEGPGLAERVRAAGALLKDAGVEAAVASRGCVGARAVVRPRDRVADLDRDRAWSELKIGDRHTRIAREMRRDVGGWRLDAALQVVAATSRSCSVN